MRSPPTPPASAAPGSVPPDALPEPVARDVLSSGGEACAEIPGALALSGSVVSASEAVLLEAVGVGAGAAASRAGVGAASSRRGAASVAGAVAGGRGVFRGLREPVIAVPPPARAL